MLFNWFWILAIVGFTAQIICYIYGRNFVIRHLPMLAMVAVMVITAVVGAMGFAAMILLVVELMLLAVIALAYILCKLVIFAKK